MPESNAEAGAVSKVEPDPTPAAGSRFPLLRLYPALGIPAFRLLWLGMIPGTLAWQMSVIASGYAALTLSGSASALGFVSSAQGIPMLILPLVGGVVADRFPRRVVLLCSQSTLGLATAVLAALAVFGVLQVWHLAAIAFVQGVAFSFNMPVRQAYTAELVGPARLRNAIALNNSGMNFSRIAGPAMAGALLDVPAVGVPGVFVLMASMYVVVVATLFRLPRPGGARERPVGQPTGREQLLEGLRYVGSSRALLTLLGLAFATTFFGMPYQTLMPIFSERVFQVGPVGLGTLMAANGFGALVGSIAVAALSSFPRPVALQIGFGIAFGLSLAGFALAPGFWIAVGLLVLVGFTSAAYLALNNSLVMSNTEPRLYGRVMSVYLMTFAIMPVAALPMAWATEQIGARITIAVAGLIVAAVVAGTAVLNPAHRRIR